ncbi:UTP--glucose-1-phosphate uridylyltransferase [Candidatus Sulfobium mesophilum]|uniref:UTP--glucose-1-phosphate uridylyltransferase n=1 Tax=Candidatus Sulfobium mesophilum TaxID=2016548 RepID=A0A2U3QK72_9BACT|nr:UTP--glucose-1-phosphate uridylyltransferase [Candidatus Sulfobium mesophilum]
MLQRENNVSDVLRKAIFPAAGLGTRFLPATKASPKEMLPIVDKPMIQYGVEEAISCGLKEIVIITGKHKRSIEDHFDYAFELEDKLRKSGKKKLIEEINRLNKIKIGYIRQGYALGLGHAISCARPFVNDEPFAVILSDDVIDTNETLLKDMVALYKKLKSPILALEKVPVSEVHRYGVIGGTKEGDGVYRIDTLVEKPDRESAPSDLAIIGRYILTPDIFEILSKSKPGKGGEIQLTDAIAKLLKKRPVYGYLFKGKRFDAGDKFGYLKATVHFALKNPELSAQFRSHILEVARKLKR